MSDDPGLQVQLQEALCRDGFDCKHRTEGEPPRSCKKNHRKCIAAAILNGGIDVRPGVRIMAVEEVAWFEDVEVNIDTLDRETPLYREATDE